MIMCPTNTRSVSESPEERIVDVPLTCAEKQGGWFITCHLSSASCQPVKKDGVRASQWVRWKEFEFLQHFDTITSAEPKHGKSSCSFPSCHPAVGSCDSWMPLCFCFVFLPSKVAASATMQLLSISAKLVHSWSFPFSAWLENFQTTLCSDGRGLRAVWLPQVFPTNQVWPMNWDQSIKWVRSGLQPQWPFVECDTHPWFRVGLTWLAHTVALCTISLPASGHLAPSSSALTCSNSWES